ncbi:hypothetical protein OG21DRAFT_1500383 [Imleria badia]|nr:hypothetical protein OG21DRAFT_1500383 [Imleria badia]
MAPFEIPAYGSYPPKIWRTPASEILNEQALEESVQKSVHALPIPITVNQPRWIPPRYPTWMTDASEILHEQAGEEAQY